MKLTPRELAKVLQVLENIDQGLIEPLFPGAVGCFLRQYGVARILVNEVLSRLALPQRADGAISGEYLDTVSLHPMLPPEVSLLHFPLGEVAETVALSEELGGLVTVTMWLKGSIANSAFTSLRTGRALQLTGDFRWFPVARVTPGEARLEGCADDVTWENARCLKAVADDIARPPHAAEYLLDYRMGPPGLKFFRTVCVLKTASSIQILPALGPPKSLACSTLLPQASAVIKKNDLAIVLIYREPWTDEWTAVRAAKIGPDEALAHSITWADFQKELDGASIDGSLVAAISSSMRASGVRPGTSGNPNLARNLLPAAQAIMSRTRTSS